MNVAFCSKNVNFEFYFHALVTQMMFKVICIKGNHLSMQDEISFIKTMGGNFLTICIDFKLLKVGLHNPEY